MRGKHNLAAISTSQMCLGLGSVGFGFRLTGKLGLSLSDLSNGAEDKARPLTLLFEHVLLRSKIDQCMLLCSGRYFKCIRSSLNPSTSEKLILLLFVFVFKSKPVHKSQEKCHRMSTNWSLGPTGKGGIFLNNIWGGPQSEIKAIGRHVNDVVP